MRAGCGAPPTSDLASSNQGERARTASGNYHADILLVNDRHVGVVVPRKAFSIWREVVAPVLLVVGLPRPLGFPWSVLITSDLGLSLALVATMGAATAVARLVFLLRGPFLATLDRRQRDRIGRTPIRS